MKRFAAGVAVGFILNAAVVYWRVVHWYLKGT